MKKLIFNVLILFLSFNVLKAQTTPTYIPYGLQSIDIDVSNATLKWRNNPNAYMWQLDYQAPLAEQSTQIETSDTIVYLSELSPSTRYAWKVRMIDVDGDTSQWSALNYFYTLSEDTLCPQIADYYFGAIYNNSVNIQWLPAEGTNKWQVVCGNPGTNPDNYDIINTTQNYEYTFNQEFIHGSNYQFAIRTDCQGTYSQWKYLYAKYVNENAVYQLPIQIDFENTTENQNIGTISTIDNPWTISSAINATTLGNKSLHISNGKTYSCNPNVSSISYAYLDFQIPETATSFYIDFSYHTYSTLQNAGLKVYLLSNGTSISVNNLPDAEFQVGEEIYRGTNNQWIREHIELPPQYIGSTRRLLFVWYNTPAAQSTHSIAIDDIYLTARYCATPDSLRAYNISDNSAMLTWNFRENQLSFNLKYKTENDTNWTTLNGITPNHLLENLESSTKYAFMVQADCGTEQSFWSDTMTFTTNTLVIPPQNLRITDYDYNSANIAWEDNLEAESFELEVTATSTNTIQYHQTNLNHIELTQLLPNTLYQIRVRAITSEEDTSIYSQIYLHTLCIPETEYPYFLEDTIQFSSLTSFCNASDCWRIESDTLFSPIFDMNTLSNPYMEFDYNSPNGVASEIFVSVNDSPLQEFDLTMINGHNAISLLGFTGDNTVRFAIRSMTSSSDVERTYTINNFTIKDTCLAPETLSVNQITHNTARVEWEGLSNITNYDLLIINLATNDTLTISNAQSPYMLTELTSMNEYKVILYSHCGTQQSVNFIEGYFTTLSSSETCMTPENFVCEHYQVKGDETIVCIWDAVEDNTYMQWEINYKERLAINWTSVMVSINPRFNLRNLEWGSEWDFRVRAICAVGDTSSWTEVVQVTVGAQGLTEEQYSGKTVKIYPNPSDSVLYIETSAIELKNAQMIDSYGRVIRAWDVLPREIDVTTFESGTYVLKFTMDNQPVSRKVTIQ